MRVLHGRIWVIFVLLSAVCGTVSAKTFYLNADKGWQDVADDPQAEYLLSVSKIKQQLLTGTQSDVVSALETLKSNFPDLAGAEIDSYLEAEKLYADANWYKAATAYRQFIDAWPDSVLQPAAMERIYSIGTAFLQGQKRSFVKLLKVPAFDTGMDLMHDISDRAGNSPMALRALTTLAENQEQKEQFKDAYYTWQEISDRWPTGQTGKNALLRKAQALHASYDGAPYDVSVVESARSYYEDYMNHPLVDDAERQKIQETIALITEQVAYKNYETGFYYERTGKPDAANQYYQKVLTNWPNSKAAKMAQARLVPDAVPPSPNTFRRRVADGTGRFLDSWFGLEPIFKKVNKQESTE